MKNVDLSRVMKIEALELPKVVEEFEGIYEIRYADNPKDYQTFDIIDLRKEISSIKELKDKTDFILDHLQNFKVIYINLDTREIRT
jgi:hypothetical protein